ncbi:MAG TPA: DNA topoisomerase IB [Solirubrobacteraceae bacterium]|nr:DNA topoisomerase IB [Solirubrobacteraceae bacterium]
MATTQSTRGRLRRSDCSGPGLRRVKRGRGFGYLDENGGRIKDTALLERVRSLAIPPAWQDVWICRDELGHLQATGIDAAGRKQYLYHPRWREHRDRQKFRRMEDFGRLLPRLRKRIASHLRAGDLERPQVLACAVRLLDVGMFRIGSEQYADDDGGIGLATIRKEHVTVHRDEAVFSYPAKSGVQRAQAIYDPASLSVVRALKRRRSGGPELLAYRNGRRWHPLRSEDINEYLKHELGEEFSAKDFRTWNATVMAAVSLATDGRGADSKTARKRAMDRSVRAVAALLGNTPAVARRSYIDPRVFDRYQSGWTIAGELERIDRMEPADDRVRARIEHAVLDLLAENTDSPALEQD